MPSCTLLRCRRVSRAVRLVGVVPWRFARKTACFSERSVVCLGWFFEIQTFPLHSALSCPSIRKHGRHEIAPRYHSKMSFCSEARHFGLVLPTLGRSMEIPEKIQTENPTAEPGKWGVPLPLGFSFQHAPCKTSSSLSPTPVAAEQGTAHCTTPRHGFERRLGHADRPCDGRGVLLSRGDGR